MRVRAGSLLFTISHRQATDPTAASSATKR